MKLKFTNHVKYRLLERGISAVDIKSVLKSPDYDEPTFGNKRKIGKLLGEKTLEVIYFHDKSDIIIVTAYYL